MPQTEVAEKIAMLPYEAGLVHDFGGDVLLKPRLRGKMGRVALNEVRNAVHWPNTLQLYAVSAERGYDAVDFSGLGLFMVEVSQRFERLSVIDFSREEVALDQDFLGRERPVFDVTCFGNVREMPALLRRYRCTDQARDRLDQIARGITLQGKDLPYRREFLDLYRCGW